MSSQYANILTRRNRMLEDAVFEPTTEHVTDTYNAVKSVPQLAKTNIEQGAPVVRGAWETIREPTASWKAYSEVGDDVLAVADDPDKIRTDDANLVMQGASQQVAAILVYGSRASMGLDGIDGFATRLNSISNEFGVFSAGGSGADLSSIYIIQWHKWYGACILYPKNIPAAGIRARDMGMHEVTTPRGYYEVWHTKFEVHWGMEIREPRNVIRYCNLETGAGAQQLRPGPDDRDSGGDAGDRGRGRLHEPSDQDSARHPGGEQAERRIRARRMGWPPGQYVAGSAGEAPRSRPEYGVGRHLRGTATHTKESLEDQHD